MKCYTQRLCLVLGFCLTTLSITASAEMVGIATSKETLAKTYAGKVYSPYAQRSFPTFPLWGETHLHTGYSMDAGLFGNRTLHDTGYRFARGEEVIASSGQPVKLSRPLDWLVIADHSDQMGFVQDIIKGDPVIMATEQGKRWNKGIAGGGRDEAQATALNLIETFSQGKLDPELVEGLRTGFGQVPDDLGQDHQDGRGI